MESVGEEELEEERRKGKGRKGRRGRATSLQSAHFDNVFGKMLTSQVRRVRPRLEAVLDPFSFLCRVVGPPVQGSPLPVVLPPAGAALLLSTWICNQLSLRTVSLLRMRLRRPWLSRQLNKGTQSAMYAFARRKRVASCFYVCICLPAQRGLG